jgi:hypothetical protein
LIAIKYLNLLMLNKCKLKTTHNQNFPHRTKPKPHTHIKTSRPNLTT